MKTEVLLTLIALATPATAQTDHAWETDAEREPEPVQDDVVEEEGPQPTFIISAPAHPLAMK